jgi:centromeric protein E
MDSNQIVLVHPSSTVNNNPNNIKSFTFDNVFDLNGNQEEVFDSLGKDLLSSAFEGYNACLFSYGQVRK